SFIASLSFTFFFFQAEDGIRVFHVTGVQTCALPISKLDQVLPSRLRERTTAIASSTVFVARPASGRVSPDQLLVLAQGCRDLERSEERRVGRRGELRRCRRARKKMRKKTGRMRELMK